MSQSTDTGDLVAALALAKAGIKVPKKGRTAQIPTKAGGKYSYSYADRSDVIEAYSAALAAQGLVMVHQVELGESMHMALRTVLRHSSGQWVDSIIPIPNTNDAQALGSFLTYFERYNSCALLDIAASDDDDGAGAVAAAPAKASKATPKAPEPAPEPPDYEVLTDEEKSNIFSAAKASGISTPGALKPVLLRIAGVESAALIPREKYGYVLEQLALMMAPEAKA